LKQSDIALILETTQQVYSRYENGVNALPIHHLITLCRFYQVSADYLLGLSGGDEI
jgi:transcriptional regulator with XRE-family HTH domain